MPVSALFSDCPEPVEGPHFSVHFGVQKGRGFDTLSPNGVGESL